VRGAETRESRQSRHPLPHTTECIDTRHRRVQRHHRRDTETRSRHDTRDRGQSLDRARCVASARGCWISRQSSLVRKTSGGLPNKVATQQESERRRPPTSRARIHGLDSNNTHRLVLRRICRTILLGTELFVIQSGS
jgi:hypothetical protein